MQVGAIYDSKGSCRFSVWAPNAASLALLLPDRGSSIKMQKDDDGYWHADVDRVAEGATYSYKLGKVVRPDPASNFQADGVHGPSRVVNHESFTWADKGWSNLKLEDMIIYEIHVGTFTRQGSFDAVIPRLDDLNELGVNTVELMPVAQFPGSRNWGYDGVYPYAVQDSYGGPDGFKRLVDACQQRKLAVILDVVYNHLGPEGNYLEDFGPYFVDTYKTPWGKALNFDGPDSDPVRGFFIQNAIHWLGTYHVDALRLDAIHSIHGRDGSIKASSFLVLKSR